MRSSDPRSWMWSEAVEMLVRAERSQRELFKPRRAAPRRACWEPPVDVLETPNAVIVFAALPGVDPATVSTALEDGHLVIEGQRVLPPQLQHAAIHRLELPQGAFYRAVRIPAGRYDDIRRTSVDGCIVITLHKHV